MFAAGGTVGAIAAAYGIARRVKYGPPPGDGDSDDDWEGEDGGGGDMVSVGDVARKNRMNFEFKTKVREVERIEREEREKEREGERVGGKGGGKARRGKEDRKGKKED